VNPAPPANGAAAGTGAAGTIGTGAAGTIGTGGAMGTTGIGGAAGTTGRAGAAGTGPGKAIGMPAMPASGALAVHTSPFPSKHSLPPGGAAPTSGLSAMAIAHNHAPAATSLMLDRSKIAIDATPSCALYK
jgi:hypothetical protein